MIGRASRFALALLVPLLLGGCFLAPGKFTSTLLVNADRSFTYSYVGEVYGFNPDEAMKGLDDKDSDDDGDTPTESALRKIAFDDGAAGDEDAADKQAATDARFREIAAALVKEQGFRKAEYVGNNKFLIDYRVSGTLDHAFLFPYNLDAGIVLPFVTVELRANGTVRMKAPGFANAGGDAAGLGDMGLGDRGLGGRGLGDRGTGGAGQAATKLDGTFTLDTDAEVVSQNSEDGVAKAAGRQLVTWKATPLSTTAPMAVLRMKDARAPAK